MQRSHAAIVGIALAVVVAWWLAQRAAPRPQPVLRVRSSVNECAECHPQQARRGAGDEVLVEPRAR